MADPDHEALLAQGVARWNANRPEHAYLSGAYLHGANLREADLGGADLSGAYLPGANLTVAYGYGADLSGADLSGAELGGAYLHGADLSGAELSGADLSGTNLSGANLSRANLAKAKSSRTVWADLDLRDVVGLEHVIHSGPSTVGVDTLYRSEGRIPPEFLRGCGLPDYFVGMVPGLTVTSAIQHSSAFISYSHADGDFADRLYGHLFHRRKIPIWLDKHEITGGDLIMQEVDRAIRRAERVILLCSEQSLSSWWVEEEIERWTKKEREMRRESGERRSMVIAVDLDGYLHSCDHDYAATILKTHVLDARAWEGDGDKLAKVHGQVERALKRNEVGPFELLRKGGEI